MIPQCAPAARTHSEESAANRPGLPRPEPALTEACVLAFRYIPAGERVAFGVLGLATLALFLSNALGPAAVRGYPGGHSSTHLHSDIQTTFRSQGRRLPEAPQLLVVDGLEAGRRDIRGEYAHHSR